MPDRSPRAAPAAVLLALVLIAGSGCASIVTPGRFRPVKVETHPAGAMVFLNEKYEGRSPLTLRVDRKEDHRVRFLMEGRETYEDTIESGLNGWLFGNLIFGGIIGIVVDGVNGSAATPKPGKFDVYLLAPGGDYGDKDQRKQAKKDWKRGADPRPAPPRPAPPRTAAPVNREERAAPAPPAAPAYEDPYLRNRGSTSL